MKFKIMLILLIPLLFFSGCGRKEDGIINLDIDSCNEIIDVNENDIGNIFRDFTCEHLRDLKGQILPNGVCYSFNIKDGKCIRVYEYILQ